MPGERKQRTGMSEVERYLCEFGAQGWELVNVINGSDKDGIMTRAVLFFKRPKATED